jgi:hypothetical protein
MKVFVVASKGFEPNRDVLTRVRVLQFPPQILPEPFSGIEGCVIRIVYDVVLRLEEAGQRIHHQLARVQARHVAVPILLVDEEHFLPVVPVKETPLIVAVQRH